MKVISVKLAWRLFLLSIAALAIIAYIGDRAAEQYASSESWVSHTRDVEAQISLLRANLAIASAAQYESHSDPAAIARYQRASSSVASLLDQLQGLTVDNPVQQENINKLRPAVDRRLQLMDAAMALQNTTGSSANIPETDESKAAAVTASIFDDMHTEEEHLLAMRTVVSDQKFLRLRITLGIGFICVLLVLVFAFRTLLSQLGLKEMAERSVRKLSAHILRIQDSERRRLGRELHDGIGQIFAGMNMEIESLFHSTVSNDRQKQSFINLQQMAADGLSQTRTISYLLHPPMLDDFGFEQAAKWYVEGFGQRSKIDVSLNLSQPFKRLPEAMELVLFRVIQEALTNVHRHSGSTRAEITATMHPDRVNLVVRDFGKGIPEDLLRSIEETSSGAGVGLGGMRERIAELGGYLTIESNSSGTTLNVSLPFPAEQESFADGGPDAQPAISDRRVEGAEGKDFNGLPRMAIDFE